MKALNTRIAILAIAFALVTIATSTLAQDPTTEARNLLDFCLHHPEACSISVDYNKSGRGYRIDYNGTRLNPLASTVKIIDLLAYAEAVNERNIEIHHINPAEAVKLDDWARFWIGQDGGALGQAYARFSAGLATPPTTVTNDQIVSAMIQESDNAAPDYLLNKLGPFFMAETVRRFITDQGG
jgi:beta-lactamase class A